MLVIEQWRLFNTTSEFKFNVDDGVQEKWFWDVLVQLSQHTPEGYSNKEEQINEKNSKKRWVGVTIQEKYILNIHRHQV